MFEIKSYLPGSADWPEAIEYGCRAGEHEARIFIQSASTEEIEAIGEGECEIGIVAEGRVIFLPYRFGLVIPWRNAP